MRWGLNFRKMAHLEIETQTKIYQDLEAQKLSFHIWDAGSHFPVEVGDHVSFVEIVGTTPTGRKLQSKRIDYIAPVGGSRLVVLSWRDYAITSLTHSSGTTLFGATITPTNECAKK
jgi:hypothetical protein